MPATKANRTTCLGYRLVAPRWVSNALSGEGARKFGGRWNYPGRPMVYLGETRALVALEMLVHLTTPLSRAKTYSLLQISIPEELISDYPLEALPPNWRNSPPGEITMEIGDDWLLAGTQLALRVPSVIIPEETNLLLNPLHPHFSEVVVSDTREFKFDRRL